MMDDIINIQLLADLEVAEEAANHHYPRFHVREDPFITLSHTKCIKIFRLNKVMVTELIEELGPFIPPPTRASAIDVKTKVLAALRFYAIGGYQDSIGNDSNVSLSQKSVSRATEEVTAAINRIMPTYIRFPIIPEEQAAVTRGFHNRYQFPGVLGIIDCTHVSIIAPLTEDPNYPEVNYLNRKGYHSLNVQLVCDVNMRILHTNALYPGSTSDKFIWQFCNLRPALVAKYEADNRMDCFLLGDGGYNLEPWMMIPDTTAQPNSPEAHFNDRQMVVRCTIERCNGLLKARFRCLLKHRVLHYHPEMASCMVNACAVLHNKCIDAGVDYEQDTDEDNYEESSESEEEIEDPEEIRRNRRRNPVLVAGEKIRARLIRKHFT